MSCGRKRQPNVSMPRPDVEEELGLKIPGALVRFLRARTLAMLTDADGAREPSSAGSSPVDSTSFPQFGVATDPEQMREIFQRHLRPLDEKSYHVVNCRIFQTRHQQNRRVVQYVLRLAEPDMGRIHKQWVTGVMYAGGRTRRIWEELRRSDPGTGTTGVSPAFAPSYYIPDLDMLVQIFPYDRRLPALPLLVAGPLAELEPSLLASFGSGDWRIEAWEAEPVRYLAEMRATLRLTVRARNAATGLTEEKRFYAKVYQDEERAEQTHEVLRALWEKAGAGDEDFFTVGRPVAYLSDLRTSVQEEVSGTALQNLLSREDDMIPVMRRVARALAALHLGQMVTSRRRLPQRDVAIVKRAGELLPLACPHLKSEIEETVSAVVAGLEEVPPVPSHCDLTLGHVWFDGDRFALIDLDEFAGADPMLDVTRLLVPLATAPLRISLPKERGQAAARAFVEEYFAHAPEAWRARLPLYYAISVLKMAGGFFRRQEPGFPDKIEILVREAREALAGEVW